MTRVQLKYVHEFIDSRGKPRRVFRRAGFPSVTLPGLPGSKEFMAAYQRALGGGRIEIAASRTLPGTFNAALAGWRFVSWHWERKSCADAFSKGYVWQTATGP